MGGGGGREAELSQPPQSFVLLVKQCISSLGPKCVLPRAAVALREHCSVCSFQAAGYNCSISGISSIDVYYKYVAACFLQAMYKYGGGWVVFRVVLFLVRSFENTVR